jgi:hypothetical protein
MFLIYIIILYLLLLKVLPFVLYPNYLLPGKVEKYPSLVKLSMELRGKDKKETLENVFRYLRKYHHSEDKIWKWESLATLFWISDFSTQSMLEKKCFLWCHTQNRLLKSLLVNSKIFKESEIKIGRMFFYNPDPPYRGISIYIHQYALVEIDKTVFKADPFYNIFEKLK